MRTQTTLSSIPLFPVASCFIIGIVGALNGVGTYLCIIASAIAVVALLREKSIVSLWAIALILGDINVVARYDKDDAQQLIGKEYIYTAEVITVKQTDNAQISKIEITGIESAGSDSNIETSILATLTIPSYTTEISAGDEIRFKSIASCHNEITDLPDQWDMTRYMSSRNIHVSFLVVDEEILYCKKSLSMRARLARVRTGLIEQIFKTGLDTDAKEFIATALLADENISQQSRQDYSAAGLSHILALSGQHVSIVVVLISLSLFPLYLVRRRKVTIVTTIVVLIVYAAITGYGSSMTRAVIMTVTYLLARVMHRQSSPYNSLIFAAMLILIFDPWSIMSIGFQLSFAAVLSILLFANDLNPVNPRKVWKHRMMQLITVSISAMMGTAIVSAYYFHTFPLYFVISNLLTVAFLPMILGGGILLIILSAVGMDVNILCTIINGIYSVFFATVQYIAKLPGAQLSELYFSAWCILPYFAALASLKACLATHRHIFGAMTMTLLCITGCIFTSTGTRERNARVYINHNHYRTDLIVDNPAENELIIFSSVPQEELAIRYDAEKKYADYMGMRHIDSVSVVTSERYIAHSGGIAKIGSAIYMGNKKILMAGSVMKVPVGFSGPDYIVVCRGYRGKISDLTEKYTPDSIILSYDLHPKRRDNYVAECIDSGYRYKVIDHNCWSCSCR